MAAATALLTLAAAAPVACDSSVATSTSAPSAAGGGDPGSGGAGASSSAGTAGDNSQLCEPGETIDCYTGANGTQNVGLCVGGVEVCADDGMSWGLTCEGEVVPQASESCLTPGDEDCDGHACGDPEWVALFGQSPATEWIRDVAVDAQGNVLIAGFFSGIANFGAGNLNGVDNYDAFVAKFAPGGTLLWGKVFAASGDHAALGVAADPSGNVLLTGYSTDSLDFGGGDIGADNDAFLVKLSPEGEHLWSRSLGCSACAVVLGSVYPTALTSDADGAIYVVGSYEGYLGNEACDCEEPDEDGALFVRKYDATGTLVWHVAGDGELQQSAHAVVVDSDGNVVVGGTYRSELVWDGAAHVGPTSDFSDHYAFTARFNSSGALLWSRSFASDAADKQSVEAIAVSASGNIVIAGVFQNKLDLGGTPETGLDKYDAFVAGLSATGETLWSHIYPGDGLQLIAGLDTTSDGQVLAAGVTEAPLDFAGTTLAMPGARSLLVAAYSPDGAELWGRAYGNVGDDGGGINRIVDRGDGTFVIAGSLTSAIDFGDGPVSLTGGEAAFIASFEY